MKNIFIIITVIISQLCFSQEYPLDYKGDVPIGGYYKDTTGELDKYVGLWKGNWDGKTLFLEFKKIKTQNSSLNSSYYYFEDRILGERKVIASNGNVEIDRITNFDNLSPEIFGMKINLQNGLNNRMTFYPKNMCRKMADLIVTNITATQMTLHFQYQPSFFDANCEHNAYVDQHGDFPINFPKDITLTKQ